MYKTNNDILCELRILWDENTIYISHFNPSKSFSIGETNDCDFYFPTKQFGIEKFPIITSINNEITTIIPYCANASINNQIVNNKQDQQIILSLGDVAEIKLSDFTFQISITNKIDIESNKSFNLSGFGFHTLSFAAHLILLSLCAFSYPALEDMDFGTISEEQKILLAQYLTSIAEKENEAQKDNVNDTKPSTEIASGKEGAAAKGSEGAMGNPSSKSINARYGVQGPENNKDPHIARQVALQEASNFGIIGLLNSGAGGNPNAPTAPWGRDESLGNDPLSAHGNLWGDSIGDSFGANGLSLSGIGEGGGGKYEGIGVGNNIGGLGYNLSKNGKTGSFDGRLKDYKPQSIKMRVGNTTTSSGKIAPEVIQRIVRQNFGRYRFCYEKGLRSDPNLAGRVSVKFVIGRNGAVMQASNGGSDLPNNEVVGCVVNAFKTLSFPAPENGIVTVGYSIALSPN